MMLQRHVRLKRKYSGALVLPTRRHGDAVPFHYFQRFLSLAILARNWSGPVLYNSCTKYTGLSCLLAWSWVSLDSFFSLGHIRLSDHAYQSFIIISSFGT